MQLENAFFWQISVWNNFCVYNPAKLCYNTQRMRQEGSPEQYTQSVYLINQIKRNAGVICYSKQRDGAVADADGRLFGLLILKGVMILLG